MADALKRVKGYYGRDAVILSTRTFTRGGFLGIGGRPVVEITAARRMSDLPMSLKRGGVQGGSSAGPLAEPEGRRTSAASPAVSPSEMDKLVAEIGSLKSIVGGLARESKRAQCSNVPEELFDTYQKLVGTDVAEQLAEQLIERIRRELPGDRLGDREAVRGELVKALEATLPTAGPIQRARSNGPTVIALVGPTGVGKTTTVAKLAANFCLREMKSVGLITIDTYRIAAVEQLKTYAQIINVPLEIVMSPDQLREAIGRMSDRDVILIDTAGRSQRDSIKIKELNCFFRAAKPDEVHLVLSSTGSEAVLSQAIERFEEVGIDRVIFTKLDEAIGFGVILTCLVKADARMSYLTTGQDVPDDIEVAGGRVLAELLLGQDQQADWVRRADALQSGVS